MRKGTFDIVNLLHRKQDRNGDRKVYDVPEEWVDLQWKYERKDNSTSSNKNLSK